MKTTILISTIICSLSLFAQPPGGNGSQGRGWTTFLETFDTNQDGLVSLEEFQAHVQTRFTGMDTNGDSVISEDEFQPGHRSGQGTGKPGRGKGMSHRSPLAAADTNQDQQITLDEWTAFVEGLETGEDGGVIFGPGRGNHPRMINLDTNENGIIEKDEFAGLFNILDQNEDGILERQEMASGRPGMHGKQGGRMPMWIFSADTDEDKVITLNEWTQFLTQYQNEDGSINLAEIIQIPIINKIMSRLDQNENGTIEMEEMQTLFDRLDRNDDRQISADDRQNRSGGKRGRTRRP